MQPAFLMLNVDFLQVCGIRPSYTKAGKSYPACGIICMNMLRASGGFRHTSVSGHKSSSGAMCVVSLINFQYLRTGIDVSSFI